MTFDEWKKKRDIALDDAPISGDEIWEAAAMAEREAKAAAWEMAHGFDKHGVAIWLRANEPNGG